MKYKVDFVREQFPAFSEASLKRWAHFENAGGSYVAGCVLKRMRKYAREMRVQPYYTYPASKTAGEWMDDSYRVLAAILNVDEDWVHIGASTTANSYTLFQAMRGFLKAGENVIVTNQDHEANSGYWRRLAEDGIEVREWKVGENAQLYVQDLEPLMDEKTRFVAFPHVSNIVGQINPAEEICRICREKGVISIVDGVSFAPHGWPDLEGMGADVYFFSTYKTYGPHQGVMAMRPELARELPNQAHGFNGEDLRKKFNPAGPDHAQVAAIAGLGSYLEDVFVKHFKEKADLGEMARQVSALQRKHEGKLLEVFFEGLEGMDFEVVGLREVDGRASTISLYNQGFKASKMAKQMTKRGVMSAAGNFYAPRILEAVGVEEVLRLSFVHYNTKEEVAKVLKGLRKIQD